MAWLSAAAPVGAAIAIILIPGLIALAPLRMGLSARVAIAAVVGIAALGTAEIVFGLVGVGWSAWQPVVPALLLGAAALLVRRRWPRLQVPPDRVRPGWVVLGWVGAAVMIGVVAFAVVPTPDRISQTYDNVFHLSAVARILESGDASSLTLRTMIETDRAWSFYPAAWHGIVAAVVQMTGAPVPTAFTATWLAVCGAVWVPGVSWLAQVLIRRGSAVLVATPLAAAFGAMPYALLTWGTLYPTFLATSLLPGAVAIPVLAWRSRATVRRRERCGFRALAVTGVVLSVVAIGVAQPRVLPTWGVLLAPFIAGVLVRAVRRSLHAGGRARRRALGGLWIGVTVVVIALGAAVALAVGPLRLLERPLADRLNGPQARADQPLLAGIIQVVAQGWPTGVAGTIAWASPLVAAAVAIGLVVAARRPRLRWVVISYGIVAVLYILAAGSDGSAAKILTGLWYKDRYRLASAIPVLGVVLATLGVLALCAWLVRRRAAPRGVAVGAAWFAALSSAVVLILTGTPRSVGEVFRLPDGDAGTAIASRDEMAFLHRLPEWIPPGQRVLNDPWDGSTLAQLLGDREPVFPHVNGQWDADRRALAFELDQVGVNPAICEALDRLRTRFVLYDDHELAGGDPAGNLFPAIHRAVESGMFTFVAGNGTTSLYRIDQCGPLPVP